MKKSFVRLATIAVIAAGVTATIAIPAAATPSQQNAESGNVTVVGDPGPGGGTSGLGGLDPVGVPVLGLIQAVLDAPGKVLPTGI